VSDEKRPRYWFLMALVYTAAAGMVAVLAWLYLPALN
jgi:hypothetical protein